MNEWMNVYNPEASIFELLSVAEMEAGLVKRMFMKWKRDWWKEYCWNGSGSVEKIVAEMEVEVMKNNVSEMKAGLMKKM